MVDVLAFAATRADTIGLLLRPKDDKRPAPGLDLLHAVGLDDDLGGTGRNSEEAAILAISIMRTHNIRYVLAGHAQNATGSYLEKLWNATTAAGATLILITEPDHDGIVSDYMRQRPSHTLDWSELPKQLGRPSTPRGNATTAPSQPQAAAGLEQASLPHVDAALFLARCRDTLAPDQYAEVRTVFADGHTTALHLHDEHIAASRQASRTAPPSNGHCTALAEQVAGALQTSPTIGHAHVTARAFQAALLTKGLLLKIDWSKLVEIPQHQPRSLTTEHYEVLRRCRYPYRAVIAVLYDNGLDPSSIAKLRLSAVTRHGQTTEDHPDVPAEALPLMQTQRRLRLLEGARENDLFLERTDRQVFEALQEVQRALQHPLIGRHAPRAQRRADRWSHRLGLTVMDIA